MNPPAYTKLEERENFLKTDVSKTLIVLNFIIAIVYFLALLFYFPHGNKILFGILMAGEVFHLWQLFTYLYTIWDTRYKASRNDNFKPPVDVFITVAGEPVEIVEETATAALNMDYPDFKVYILNDGYVAKKDNYKQIEEMADRIGVHCITRKIPGGAKAGNINNALRLTKSPYVTVFDADHVPHRDFLQKTVGYFHDPKMGYVQSPQFYKNYDENQVTQGAWEQQALFFGPICKGKNRLNSTSMCGTNMVIKRDALNAVGNICEESIAEDFVTGLFIHEKGYKSTYVPEVLAEGLAPEDFLSYYKQQFRWARGSMDVLFKYNVLFRKGLTLAQKIQYTSSASFFLSGTVVLMNALIPLIFFFTGLVAIQTSTMAIAALFLPYIVLTIFNLQASANFSYSFRSLAFSMAGFNIHISALLASLLGKKSTFQITSKKKITGNFLYLVIPHIVYVALVATGMTYAVLREGFAPSVITNFAWAILNAVIFSEFVSAAAPSFSFSKSKKEKLAPVTVANVRN